MFTTLVGMGVTMGLWALIVATTPGYQPHWLQTASHGLGAVIGMGFVVFHPFTAALDTTSINQG
jgi:hypothetical protein